MNRLCDDTKHTRFLTHFNTSSLNLALLAFGRQFAIVLLRFLRFRWRLAVHHAHNVDREERFLKQIVEDTVIDFWVYYS